MYSATSSCSSSHAAARTAAEPTSGNAETASWTCFQLHSEDSCSSARLALALAFSRLCRCLAI